MGTSVMPGWGTVIGGVIGAGMGYIQGADGKPIPIPTTSKYMYPGATSNPYGGSTYDQYTGLTQQTLNNFDPSQQGRINDADMMYNSFMGNDNSRITGNLDYQIAEMQRQIDKYNAQLKGDSGVGKKQSFADFNPGQGNWVNAQGEPLKESELRSSEAVRKQYAEHVARVGGKEGGGGFLQKMTHNDMIKSMDPFSINSKLITDAQDPNFEKWLAEAKKNNDWENKVKTYNAQEGQRAGNQSVINDAIASLQQKLGYATQEKERITTGGGADLSKNPLMKYLGDVGGNGMLQGANGGNPSWMTDRQAAMDATAASAQARSGGGPMDTSGVDEYIANMNKQGNLANGLDAGSAGSINAPKLDMQEAGLKQRIMNAATDQTYGAQRNLNDQAAAHRGLLASSISEVGRAGDSLNLANSYNQNALGATQAYNSALGQQFGMDLSGAQFNGDQQNQLFNRQLGKAQFGQQNAQQQFSNLLGAGQLKLSAKSQADQQANWGDTFANQNSQGAIGNQWNLYNAGRAENQDAYTRNLGMYNLLNNQSQQARGNQAQDFQLSTGSGQAQLAAQQSAGLNNYNAAQNQMTNANNMAQWQMQQNQTSAQNQNMWNSAAGLGQAWGNYNQNNSQYPAPNSVSTPAPLGNPSNSWDWNTPPPSYPTQTTK